jgi:ribosomal protein S26
MSKLKLKKKYVEVAAMADMSRRERRITNNLANALVARHHMCLDCAIKNAVALVKSQRPEHEHTPIAGGLCSDACGEALREFFESMGVKGEPVDEDELATVLSRRQ